MELQCTYQCILYHVALEMFITSQICEQQKTQVQILTTFVLVSL